MTDQTDTTQQTEPEAETDEAVASEPETTEPQAPDFEAIILDLKDQVLRAKAEVENTRRIATREKQDASKYALTNFARDILRVADNLGFAMMSVSEEARKADQNLDNLFVGIDMTMKELLSVFGDHNIKPVPADGELFDHNIHEAVQQIENTDVPANTVMKTLRGGYMLHDRLLRPAQVIVATGGSKPEPVRVEEASTIDITAQVAGQHIDQET